jgi:cysteine desulfurase
VSDARSSAAENRDGPVRTYFDAATAVPLHPVARQAFAAALDDGWADPARLYTEARRAGQLLDAARAVVAEVIGARPDEVTFCANGSVAAHLAVLGGLAGRRRAGSVFVHSAVEHSSVLHAAESHGTSVSIPVDRAGRVSTSAFAGAVRAPGVALAALMSANHEVGSERYSRSPRWQRRARRRAFPCTWTPRSRWAVRRCRRGGRC